MKRRMLPLWALVLLLSACAPAGEGEPAPPPEEGLLKLESLFLEVPRGDLSAQELARTVQDLPEALRGALADYGVEDVRVSVGSSPSATAQAVAEGGVDLALLPAEDYASLEKPPSLLLTASPAAPDLGTDPAAWNGGPAEGPAAPGAPALLCAAPTEYGRALAEKTDPLTWEDLTVRWGAVEEEDFPTLRAVDQWLWERFGETTAHVALSCYDSYEALFQAAAAGEVDLVPLRDDLRREWAEAWTLDASETDGRGVRGLGRSAPLWEELPVLAATERFCSMTVSVRPGNAALTGESFAQALAEALNALKEDYPALNAGTYTPADAQTLLYPKISPP